MYTHIAEDGVNILANLTSLDHPLLNDNPDAKLIVTHNRVNTPAVNNHPVGVFYITATDVWVIYNEDTAAMPDGAGFNIYIAQGDEVILHEATAANQGNGPNTTLIDDPSLNDNLGRLVFTTNYFNANEMNNNNNYGIFYNDIADRRGIYSEDGQPIPTDAGFFVLISGIETNVATFRHAADEANTVGNLTTLDVPLLNNNPDAIFVAEHYFGVLPNSDVTHDSVYTARYSTTSDKWTLLNEDGEDMPVGIVFDLMIFDETLGVGEANLSGLEMYPNPATDLVYFTGAPAQNLQRVDVIDVTGKKVMSRLFDENISERSINVAALQQGTYFLNVISGSGSIVKKLIKK